MITRKQEYKDKVKKLLGLLVAFPMSKEEKSQWLEVVPYMSELDLDEALVVFGEGMKEVEKLDQIHKKEIKKMVGEFEQEWENFKKTSRKKILERANQKSKEEDLKKIQIIRQDLSS